MSKYIITNGELYHWGIKGMKWGKRRYQNKDGSLTAAGRERYGDDRHDDYKRARSKPVSSMSDQELNTALNRMRMEQQYNDYIHPKKAESAGKKWVSGLLTETSKQIVKKYITDYQDKYAKPIVDKYVDKFAQLAMSKLKKG